MAKSSKRTNETERKFALTDPATMDAHARLFGKGAKLSGDVGPNRLGRYMGGYVSGQGRTPDERAIRMRPRADHQGDTHLPRTTAKGRSASKR